MSRHGRLFPWLHTLLAWLLLVLVLSAVGSGLVWPAWAQRIEHKQQQELLLRRIHNYQKQLARRPALEAELTKLEYTTATNRQLLDQPTAALAAAELQRQVRSLVERHGGRLQSSSVLPPQGQKMEAAFQRISLTLRLREDLSQLSRSLYELDQNSPRIFLDKLLIHHLSQSRKSSLRRRPQLEIQLELSAFLAPQETP